ncbi:MAG: DUF4174 domain-containing protein [Phycisphaerales bacterium]|nr:DUF4174 domain-containing protein [Phycisphaerales bacterium]
MPDTHDSNWFANRHWQYRLIIISGSEEEVQRQRDRFLEVESELRERDTVMLTIARDPDHPAATWSPEPGSITERYSISTDSFQVILIGKDGQVKERSSSPVAPQDVLDCIDLMPMRIAEARQRSQDQEPRISPASHS